MLLPRIIPCLLLDSGRLVKTRRFADPVYLGDPLHVVKILQDMGAGEIILLDRSAGRRGPSFDVLRRIAAECHVPLTYGGGIRSVEEVKQVLGLGIEKVAIRTAAVGTNLVSRAAEHAGSQSVIVSVDVQHGVVMNSSIPDPAECAREAQKNGAGEILLTSVERDGCMEGYDLALIRAVTAAVHIPVAACGGAGNEAHLAEAIAAGAAAAAAGSMFVFQGRNRAVLPFFPSVSHV